MKADYTKICCNECKTLIPESAFLEKKGKRDSYAATGRAYCSKACGKEFVRRSSSETMRKTNFKHASARMKIRNPMRLSAARTQMQETLKEMGWRPPVRGGNGQGPTVPQKLLAGLLRWPMEVAISTEQPRGSGYPTCYKVDVGNALLRVAIEVDGMSHGSLARRAQDQKKDLFLASLGWKVLRFSNQEVLETPDAVVAKILSTISK